jgi:DNA-binding MarR family transcriptional regulator
MSQNDILALMSDQPITRNEIRARLCIDSGILSHRLNSLIRKGLIERKVLEVRYRPFGYTKVAASDRPADAKMRWPGY